MTLKIRTRWSILFSLSILISGCATMFSPDSDRITIKSDPEGVSVYDGANLLGTTPLTHTFDRDTFEPKTLSLKMAGYKSQELFLNRTLEKTALFNFGFILTSWGATSWGIDALSGNMIKYFPDSYFIELEKEGDPTAQEDLLRRQRLRYVVLNRFQLMNDIAAGDGEYLRAFFEIRPPRQFLDDYQQFLRRIVSNHSLLSLRLDDPIAFFL